MTPGDRVMIYEDPITKLRPEGRARLIEKFLEVPGEEFWKVRFMDGFKCYRWIKIKEEK